jgi:lipopolysaccharide biosynthesis protein
MNISAEPVSHASQVATEKIRLIAFYLPQFHPIPENDEWWGKGFTEWANVAKAKPLFKGHYQPHLPADLGFYDLRLPEARLAQADLAREYGIHGFCYYHYWFNGRRVLNRPFDEVLNSGAPDFPFCLCWANENWTRAWDGRSGTTLLEQNYSLEDDRAHMQWLADAFRDPRYIRVEGKPLFLVYRAGLLPDPKRTTEVWREEAAKLGIGEIYLSRVESFSIEQNIDPQSQGFDAAVDFQPDWTFRGQPLKRSTWWNLSRQLNLSEKAYGEHQIFEYTAIVKRMLRRSQPAYTRFPCVTPSWDNSPRRKTDAVIMRNSHPEIYQDWLCHAICEAEKLNDGGLVFINAWNEWAEGNHLEPCLKWGIEYLKATRKALFITSKR